VSESQAHAGDEPEDATVSDGQITEPAAAEAGAPGPEAGPAGTDGDGLTGADGNGLAEAGGDDLAEAEANGLAAAANGAEAGEAEEAEAEEADPVAAYLAELRLLPGDWYVVHSYAGYENRVKGNLESRTQSLNMEDYIFQIEVPVHQVTEIK